VTCHVFTCHKTHNYRRRRLTASSGLWNFSRIVSTEVVCQRLELRPMSHLQLYRATKSQVWHCVLHTVTLSHKQELTNQRSPHFLDKVAPNSALLYSEKGVVRMARSCATRHVTVAILSSDKVAQQNRAIKLQVWHRSKIDFGCKVGGRGALFMLFLQSIWKRWTLRWEAQTTAYSLFRISAANRRKAPSIPVTTSKQRCRMLQVKRFFRQQCRMLLRHCCHFWQQCCQLRQQCRTKFRPFDKVTNWACSICFDFVERTKFYNRIIRHCFCLWQQSQMLLRQSRRLLPQCCWCGRGLRHSRQTSEIKTNEEEQWPQLMVYGMRTGGVNSNSQLNSLPFY